MFSTIHAKSTAVTNLAVSPANNQVLVEYNNGRRYLYNNVSEDSILDVIYGEITSLGFFVNAYCKGKNFLTVG